MQPPKILHLSSNPPPRSACRSQEISEIPASTGLSTIKDLISKRHFDAFATWLARLPASTPANHAVSEAPGRFVTEQLSDFHAAPTGSGVLLVCVVGVWINGVRTTTPQPTCSVPPSGEAVLELRSMLTMH